MAKLSELPPVFFGLLIASGVFMFIWATQQTKNLYRYGGFALSIVIVFAGFGFMSRLRF